MTDAQKKITGIAKLFCLADTEEKMMKLLSDLLTGSEIDKIHERIKIVECLSDGLSHRETAQKSGAAIATVTRGASVMKKSKKIIDSAIAEARNLSWWQSFIWRV